MSEPSKVHTRDCAPCDTAREIADELAALWDPLDNWTETESPYTRGQSLYDDLVATAADVLHRRLPTRRPSTGDRR